MGEGTFIRCEYLPDFDCWVHWCYQQYCSPGPLRIRLLKLSRTFFNFYLGGGIDLSSQKEVIKLVDLQLIKAY